MTKDYTTVRVEKAAKSVADDAKDDDETWSDYIRRCADADASVQRLVDADALAAELESDVADLVADRLGGDATGDAADGDTTPPVDPDALADAVAARINDDVLADRAADDGSVWLDASERRAIAEEVAEVLR